MLRYPVSGPYNRAFTSINRAVRPLAVLLALCCCLSAVGAQWRAAPQQITGASPGFDPKDIVRQVRSAQSPHQTLDPSNASPDDGEFLIDTTITLAPAPIYQEYPATAFDGANFMVVWQDIRNGLDYDIYGTRVTSAGVVLDPNGITISTAVDHQEYPAIAFTGGNFLVVWRDKRSGSYDIYGARVTPSGVMLDTAGIAISTATDNQTAPAVAADAADFFVVWEDRRSDDSADIYGARVTAAGFVLDPIGIAVSTAADNQRSPAISFDGVNFLAVWRDSRANDTSRRGLGQNQGDAAPLFDAIYGSRVTPAGVVLDTAGIVISQAANDQRDPALAFDGTNFLVVWADERNGLFQDDIYGARVTPAGGVLDAAGIAISTAAYGQYDPSLAFDGDNYFVAWADERSRSGDDIYGTRVTPVGIVLDTAGIVVCAAVYEQLSPALAYNGDNFLVAWGDDRNGSELYGARVSPTAVVLDTEGIDISIATNIQYDPALAFDGENFLVVWGDNRAGDTSDIYGARVTSGGVVLDPTGIPIATAALDQHDPTISFDGVNYLVVWANQINDPDIYGTRVTTGGVVLDPSGIVITTAANDQEHPAAAFDGNNFLVVWEDQRSGMYEDIYAARVTPAGVVLDTAGIPVSTAANHQMFPALTFDGDNYLVIWDDSRSHSHEIYGTRVALDGSILDTGIAISLASSSQPRYPAITSSGSGSLVVWCDGRGGKSDIYGARVTPAGVVLDTSGIAIATAAGWHQSPAPAFDGESFLVVWERRGVDSTDIYGAGVTSDGVVFRGGAVVSQLGDQHSPALARGSGSDIFLVYDGWAGTVGSKTYNADRIWGKMNPHPAVEERTRPEGRRRNTGASIVRGVLFLDEASSHKPQAASLLDAGGRKVMDLKPGANNVRALAPGVYFVRAVEAQAQAQAQVTRKVIITR